MIKPDYCTQNDGHCPSCPLANDGRDCANNKFYTLGPLAEAIMGGNLAAMAKMLNDVERDLDLNILEPDPGAFVPRPVLMDLYAYRVDEPLRQTIGELLGGN